MQRLRAHRVHPALSIFPASLAIAAILAAGAVAQNMPTSIPPGWISGDTHAHMQKCRFCGSTFCPDPDETPAELYAEQVLFQVAVTSNLIWNPPGILDHDNLPGLDEFASTYVPMVTGDEDAATQGDPSHVLQTGVEVSGFAASQFGHIVGLDIEDAIFDVDAKYAAPIFDAFRIHPRALVGYAHAGWVDAYEMPPWYGYPNRVLPYLAAIDLAQGKAQLIEVNTFNQGMPNKAFTWTGLYYKLLNAGLRPVLVAGSDNCDWTTIGYIRCYALTDSSTPSYDRWTAAAAAGRTSLAYNSAEFLQLTLEDHPVGDQIDLAAPATLHGKATFHLGAVDPISDTLEIVQDGQVVSSEPFTLSGNGVKEFAFSVDVARSGWIVARTFETHTAAIYVVVDQKPIARALDAGYWSAYCDDISAHLDHFDTEGSTQAILDHIAGAKRVFDALAALDSPLPAGVSRLGTASGSVRGPSAIGIDGAASAGNSTFKVNCVDAPPSAEGWFILGLTKVPAGEKHQGIRVYVDTSGKLNETFTVVPVHSNEGGYCELSIPIPPNKQGLPAVAQFVWREDGSAGRWLSATDALDAVVQ